MQYKNFDIELYEYEESKGVPSFKVRVTNSPVGDQSPSQAERVTLADLHLADALGLMTYGGGDPDAAIDFGEALATCLLPTRVRERWSESIRLLKENEALRLRLKLDAWQVAWMPWELAYVSRPTAWGRSKGADGFLALDRRVSIVRYEYTDYPFIPFEPGENVSLRQLVLLSSPRDLPPLDLNAEAKNIADALGSVTNLALDRVENVTVEALQEALQRPAHIFHFAGHGAFEARASDMPGLNEGEGNIVLCERDGTATLFPADKLALNLIRCGVRIAFLNSEMSATRDRLQRLSGLAPALAHAGIPAVIGLNGLIADRAAITFSKIFYRNLAAGSPVDTAVTNARLAVFNQSEFDSGLPYWAVPVLYLRTDESTLFPIRPRPSKAAEEQASMPSDVALRRMLVTSFEKDELELLCADITAAFEQDGIQQRVDLEIVGGSSLESYALNLIQHLERRDLLSYLVDAVKAARPHLSK